MVKLNYVEQYCQPLSSLYQVYPRIFLLYSSAADAFGNYQNLLRIHDHERLSLIIISTIDLSGIFTLSIILSHLKRIKSSEPWELMLLQMISFLFSCLSKISVVMSMFSKLSFSCSSMVPGIANIAVHVLVN